jgi:hypothetical protein
MNPEFVKWLREQECAPFGRGGKYTLVIRSHFLSIRKIKDIIDES